MFFFKDFLLGLFVLISYGDVITISQGRIKGGGHCAMPPFWVFRIVKLHRKVSKIEAWPSPLPVGHKV